MNKKELKALWRARRPDLAAIAAIVVAFCAAFGWAIFRGKFLLGGDVFFDTYPLRTVAWDMIRHGQLPLWTPHVWSGYPMLAMATLGLGYPLTWAHLFLPSHWAEEVYVLAPFLLAPSFTYAYAREVGRTRVAALAAALSFGYGGLTTNTYGMNGQPTNALMWLPLMLIMLERARRTPFIPCIVGATLIYSLSVLTGHGHSAMQVGTLALAYALFLALGGNPHRAASHGLAQGETNGTGYAAVRARADSIWPRWRPFAVCAVAVALACGVAAFQILETMRAVRRSIRGTVSYDFFSAGGFTPAEALRSLVAPLYHYLEVTTYQAPLVCVLSAAAIVWAMRRRKRRDARVFFWLAVALVAFVLLLGGHTPFYRLLYRVPVFNLFRRPSRYVCEWTFSLSILAAYGWDALPAYVAARARRKRGGRTDRVKLLLGLLLLLLSVGLAMLWWRAVRRGGAEMNYLRWKLWFTLATAFAIGYAWRVLAPPLGKAVATCALVLVCLVEPFILIGHWWPGTAKSTSRLTTPALTTRWLQQFPPAEQRVYVRVNGPGEEAASQPRFDALDRTAMFGLHNVAGYQPLIFERYSRALGNVEFDAISPRSGFAATRALFEPRSHVLEILNAGYAVVWPDLAVMPESSLIERDGVRFAHDDLGLTVAPGESLNLRGAAGAGDQLVLVTSLADSVGVQQGTMVARLRVVTTDGHVIERNLRAGVDTAEWAYERADVRAAIQHQVAAVFDSAFNTIGSYDAHRYWARLPLGARASVSRIEIENVAPPVTLALWKATLYDTSGGRSTQLTNRLDVAALDPTRWQIAAQMNGVLILRNLHACPRAWLVAEAQAVDGEEALRRIGGESPHQFDPRRTALLEVRADELPPLRGGDLSPASTAHITRYEANRLTIETNAPTPTVLVISEIFYPGWVAFVDGQPTRINVADYLLRGVALAAGSHRVEMQYTAPAARTGAIISACALLLLGALAVFARRMRRI